MAFCTLGVPCCQLNRTLGGQTTRLCLFQERPWACRALQRRLPWSNFVRLFLEGSPAPSFTRIHDRPLCRAGSRLTAKRRLTGRAKHAGHDITPRHCSPCPLCRRLASSPPSRKSKGGSPIWADNHAHRGRATTTNMSLERTNPLHFAQCAALTSQWCRQGPLGHGCQTKSHAEVFRCRSSRHKLRSTRSSADRPGAGVTPPHQTEPLGGRAAYRVEEVLLYRCKAEDCCRRLTTWKGYALDFPPS